MTRQELADLQQSVRENQHVSVVYISRAGKAYFNKYPLDGKFYGKLPEILMNDAEKKNSGVGAQIQVSLLNDAEIVSAFTRDMILAK